MKVIQSDDDVKCISIPELRNLIDLQIDAVGMCADHFSELVYFVVVEEGDSISTLDGVLGFPLLANRFDGVRFGDSAFAPSWEVLAEHTNYYELVYVLGDDGAGVVVFVGKDLGAALGELLSMCALFAIAEADK